MTRKFNSWWSLMLLLELVCFVGIGSVSALYTWRWIDHLSHRHILVQRSIPTINEVNSLVMISLLLYYHFFSTYWLFGEKLDPSVLIDSVKSIKKKYFTLNWSMFSPMHQMNIEFNHLKRINIEWQPLIGNMRWITRSLGRNCHTNQARCFSIADHIQYSIFAFW